MYVNFLQTNYKLLVIEFIAAISLSAETFPYAPINGLPQDGGGVGQPKGIWLRKAHMGWDFDITAIPRVGNLTRPPSWKVERIWEWVTSGCAI